jgi:hypothetical protein
MSSATPRPGGRRVAAPSRHRPGASAVTALVLLALSALAVLAVRSPEPAAQPGSAEGSVVDRSLLACPGPPDQRGVRGRTEVGLAKATGPRGPLGAGGTVSVGPPGSVSAFQVERGELSPVDVDQGVVVDAAGEAAAGVFGDRVDRAGAATAAGRCEAPRAEWWFVGAGAGLDHASTLELTNADPGPAVVDVRVLGEDGPIETVGTRGITIAAGETRTIALVDVAPQNDEVAVHVQASRGRVAATLTDSFASRPAARSGFERVPAAELAARSVRLAGVPARASSRTLVVANPSDREALVDLEVVGSRGSFVPSGFETLSVPPGSVRVVDGADLVTGKEATALRVTSQVPVVAGFRSVRAADHSYAATVVPLTESAVAPVVAGSEAVVQVSAGSGGATVAVEGFASDGRSTEQDQVEVDPAATATWSPGKDTDYVLVTPVRGNVYGATTYAGRSGMSTVPLVALPLRVQLPGVVPAPR